jgi:alpha-beta hydrolase superfamily lysophospholipase
MKILFLHGYGSDPNGIRPIFLEESGYEVIHPALPDEDFAESLRIAQEAFDQGQPDVIVGSSRGGAVAMNMDTGNTPLVLIAPSWKKRGTATTVKARTIILHSAHDDVVPFDDSRELLRRSGLPEDRLVVVGENHRMVDQAAFGALLEAVEIFSKSHGGPDG